MKTVCTADEFQPAPVRALSPKGPAIPTGLIIWRAGMARIPLLHFAKRPLECIQGKCRAKFNLSGETPRSWTGCFNAPSKLPPRKTSASTVILESEIGFSSAKEVSKVPRLDLRQLGTINYFA